MPVNIYEHEELARSEADVTKAVSVERVAIEDGIKVYLEGYPYPMSGYATSNAVSAVNIVKRLARSLLRFRNIWALGDTLRIFTDVGMQALRSHVLRVEYMQPVSRELRAVIARIAGDDIATLVSHIIEYDSAYRFRVHDMLAHASQDAMVHRPMRALWRMLAVNRAADYPAVHRKLRCVVWVLMLWLLWPPNRARWGGAWAMADFGRFHMDDASAYWLSIRTDYGPNNPNRCPPSLSDRILSFMKRVKHLSL